VAGALATVLLAFLHAAVAGQEAGVTQLLGHGAGPGGLLAVGGGLLGLQAEHHLQGPGNALRAGARLAGEAAAVDLDADVEAGAPLRQAQRALDRVAVPVPAEATPPRAVAAEDLPPPRRPPAPAVLRRAVAR